MARFYIPSQYDGPLYVGMYVELRGGVVGQIARFQSVHPELNHATAFQLAGDVTWYSRAHIQPFGTADLHAIQPPRPLIQYCFEDALPGFFNADRAPP
jgi:hypothetical protein